MSNPWLRLNNIQQDPTCRLNWQVLLPAGAEEDSLAISMRGVHAIANQSLLGSVYVLPGDEPRLEALASRGFESGLSLTGAEIASQALTNRRRAFLLPPEIDSGTWPRVQDAVVKIGVTNIARTGQKLPEERRRDLWLQQLNLQFLWGLGLAALENSIYSGFGNNPNRNLRHLGQGVQRTARLPFVLGRHRHLLGRYKT